MSCNSIMEKKYMFLCLLINTWLTNLSSGWLPSVVHIVKKTFWVSEVSAPRAQPIKDCLELKDIQSYLVLDVWEPNMESLQKGSVPLAASSQPGHSQPGHSQSWRRESHPSLYWYSRPSHGERHRGREVMWLGFSDERNSHQSHDLLLVQHEELQREPAGPLLPAVQVP